MPRSNFNEWMSNNVSISTSCHEEDDDDDDPTISRRDVNASTAFSLKATSGTSAAFRALSYRMEGLRLTLSMVMEWPCLVEWVKPRPMAEVWDEWAKPAFLEERAASWLEREDMVCIVLSSALRCICVGYVLFGQCLSHGWHMM